MNKRTARRPYIPLFILSVCLVFLAVSGFTGGYEMLRDPYVAPMGMAVSVLERTPFQDFFIPGLLLIMIWGCGSVVALAGLWLHPRWAALNHLIQWTHEQWEWVLTVLMGLGLLVWLTFQLITLPAVAPIQYILYGLALLLVLVPLLPNMRSYYRNHYDRIMLRS